MLLELLALVLFFITLCKIVDEDCKKRINSALAAENKLERQHELVKETAEPVFVAPPPPHEEPSMNKPRARLCKLEKSTQSDEFGFNLHAEKGRGHFIGTVDQGGIGDRAGLRMGQRIVGVNGVLVYPNTPHKEVVAQIKRSPLRTTLLVASEEVDRWYKENNAEYSFDYIEEEEETISNNELSPHSTEEVEQIEVEEVHEVVPCNPETEPQFYQHEPAAHPAAEAVAHENTDAIMEQVFAGLPPPEPVEVELPPPSEPELLMRSPELPTETLGAGVRPPSPCAGSTHSHESAADAAPAPHYVPTYEPRRPDHAPPAQVSPPSNGSSLNGYPTSSDSVSPIADKFDIFGLSAQEARERLRQNKKNIHRGFDMSLEEKYRLVSNM